MSHAATHHQPLKLPLIGAGIMILLAILITASARLSGISATQELGPASVVSSRTLRFADGDHGSVLVYDGATGKVIATAAPGTNGFLRGALRGLMRVRKVDAVDYAAPYLLRQMSNGQLLLTDQGQNITLDLNAYGRTNAAVFEAFLSATGDKS